MIEKVFEFFKEFSKIPHGSGNTKQISDYLADFAKKRNLEHYQDELDNIIIIKEAGGIILTAKGNEMRFNKEDVYNNEGFFIINKMNKNLLI